MRGVFPVWPRPQNPWVPYPAFTVLQQVYTTEWCRPRGRCRPLFSPSRPPAAPAHGGTMSTATASAAPAKKRGSGLFQGLQKVGRSLQLPIAVLPAAGILLRLGQSDVFGDDGLGWHKVASVFATAGGALFDALPLLFCVGVAIGFAKKSDGSTALAALVGFLSYYAVIHQYPIKDGHEGATYTGTGLGGGFWQKGHEAAQAATFQNPGVLGGIILGLLTAV